MKNSGLDICLSPVTSSLRSSCRDSTVNKSLATKTEEINAIYGGKLQEYDLVEIQNEYTKIRAIIEMASKERGLTEVELAPMSLKSPLGFSVKRSVKRFLEKRKKRSKYSAPYSYTYTSTSSSFSHNF